MESSTIEDFKVVPMRGDSTGEPPKPAAIEIAGSIARPADPNAHSFVTSFPAEIRNAVYELLFKRDPVVLMETYHQVLSWENKDDETIWSRYPMIPYHGLASVMPFLLVCRQIYHEATAVVYGENTFVSTASWHMSEYDFVQIKVAAEFINSIGSQAGMLNSVVIDAGPRPSRQNGAHYCELLPLVSALWARPDMASRVYFAQAAGLLSLDMHPYVVGSQVQDYSTPEVLNKVLHALTTADCLNLRRYGQFERLLSHIYVDADIESGTVFFWGDHLWDTCVQFPPERNATMLFDTDNEGDEFDVYELPQDPGARIYGDRIYQDIIRYASVSPQPIVFDLDRKLVKGLRNNLLAIDQSTKKFLKQDYGKNNKFTLKFSTSQNPSTFDGFQSLTEFLCGEYTEFVCLQYTPIKYNLHFQLDEVALSDIRVDAMTLFEITNGISGIEHFRSGSVPKGIAVFSRGPKDEPDIQLEMHDVEFQTMQRSAFVLVSSILLNAPSLATQPVPDIWFDGFGAAIEAVYTSGCTKRRFRNPAYGQSVEDTWIMGRDYMTQLDPPQRFDGEAKIFRGSYYWPHWKDCTLQDLWMNLQYRQCLRLVTW